MDKYKRPSWRRGGWQLASTLALFIFIWVLMARAVDRHYAVTLLLALPAAGLLMRLFMIQHDCGHGSFFPSSWANDSTGAALGLLTLTPYKYWLKTHAIHHATSGNLDRRGWGDIDTLTIEEYSRLSRWERFKYRLYRNPLVLFGVGPIFQFLVKHRFPGIVPDSWKQERLSILRTDLALAVMVATLSYAIGLERFAMIQLPITAIACSLGVWLFYVQHQFDPTYWERDERWDYVAAGLQGSSYYKLPKALQWITANIGLHHIHHLSSRIPNYELQRCMDENSELRRIEPLTFWNSLKCVFLILWDEKQGKLTTLEEARMQMNATPAGTEKRLDWVNIVFFTATPVIALGGTAWYSLRYGVTWLEIANFLLMYVVSGIAITGGYHRLYAHRSYDCGKGLKLFYLLFGAGTAEHSVLNWASDHRDHHRFVDGDQDPYSIAKGAFFAHMGWLFYKDARPMRERYRNVPDLLKDPWVRWQSRWYVPLMISTGFLFPMAIGMIEGRPIGGLLWGGFLRMVVFNHATFCINSLAHLWGTRSYTLENSARDNWLLGPLVFGEGYHNFHHAFQADYRNGVRWYHFDMGKWWIRFMSWFGWTWNLRRASESAILMAKLRVQMRHLERCWAAAGAPSTLWERVQARVQRGRERVEAAMSQYYLARAEYMRQKRQWSSDIRREWKEKLAQYRADLDAAMAGWRQTLRAMHRYPRPSAQGLLTLTALLDVFRMRGGL